MRLADRAMPVRVTGSVLVSVALVCLSDGPHLSSQSAGAVTFTRDIAPIVFERPEAIDADRLEVGALLVHGDGTLFEAGIAGACFSNGIPFTTSMIGMFVWAWTSMTRTRLPPIETCRRAGVCAWLGAPPRPIS